MTAYFFDSSALYFEDVLDYLAIPQPESASLAQRWRLPVPESTTENVTLVDPEMNEDGEISWPSDAWEDGWDDQPEGNHRLVGYSEEEEAIAA